MFALGVVLAAAVVVAAGPTTPEEAIAAAVRARLGRAAVIDVLDIDTDVAQETGLAAQPDAAARLSKPSRFVLFAGGVRRGLAVATVRVRSPYPRAARAIARDEAIGVDAVDFIEGELPSMEIRPLLTAAALTGLMARRNIAAGEVLTASVLRVPPVVKSGDEVNATLRLGTVSVTTTGIASGSGQIGDMIRVSQPHRSGLLKGRITGPGAVEIVE